MNVIGYLIITDYSQCYFGEHFYGRIEWREGGEKLEERLSHKINKREAISLNRAERDRDYLWRVGDKTERYFTHDDLIHDAIEFCKQSNIALLLEGYPNTLNPLRVIYSREPQLELTEIGDNFQALYDAGRDPWKDSPELVKELEKRWAFLIQAGNFSYG